MTATTHGEASRWLAWAADLTRRFAVSSRRRRGLPLELLRQRAAVIVRRIAWRPTIAVNVSLSHLNSRAAADRGDAQAMTLASAWRMPLAADSIRRRSPSPPWTALPAPVVSRRSWPVPPTLPETRPVRDDLVVHRLVERVLARADRVERRAAGRDLVLAAPAAAALRRPAVDTGVFPPLTTAHSRPSSGPWGGPEPLPSSVTVDRIADQVLQQLDRRVTAFRERMGRA
jgi:hypothetical protein